MLVCKGLIRRLFLLYGIVSTLVNTVLKHFNVRIARYVRIARCVK